MLLFVLLQRGLPFPLGSIEPRVIGSILSPTAANPYATAVDTLTHRLLWVRLGLLWPRWFRLRGLLLLRMRPPENGIRTDFSRRCLGPDGLLHFVEFLVHIVDKLIADFLLMISRIWAALAQLMSQRAWAAGTHEV